LSDTRLPPASGAWQEGDPPGDRLFADSAEPFALEAGEALPGLQVAYVTWGELNADRSNAVLIEHALTADSHVIGAAGPGHPTAGWWNGLVGPGLPLDPAEVFVVASNVLGGCQGTTGPSSAAPDGARWGSRFPFVTIRDQVAAEALLADHLGIGQWALVIGGSMGGMRALEWAVSLPSRVRGLFVVAAGGAASAEQIAWCAPQLAAIRADPGWLDGDYYDAPPGAGPYRGLGVARQIAHVTYRSEPEFAARFGRDAQPGENPWETGRYAVESYLDHQADKLVKRFDAGSYVTLTRAMNSHDVGRGRGGIEAALRRVTADSVIAGIDTDRLYPIALQQQLADGLGVDLQVIGSRFGHDGFLLETEQVGELVRKQLAQLL
jgi:homoserine O-acetyltransferase